MRAVLLLAATSAALIVGSGASASRQSAPWAAYLAPLSACPAGDGRGSAGAQQHEMACLINWMRRRIGARQLSWSSRLAYVADAKAHVVIQCGDFSHYPCGSRWPTAAATAKRAWNVWGENLYVGNLWLRTPRAAMLAWLESTEHRLILFGRAWTRLGVSVQPARALAGGSDMSLWVLEVAGRR